MNSTKGNKRNQKRVAILAFGVSLIFLFVGVWGVRALISSDSTKRVRKIQMVSLLKPPPPPPKVERKPPEPPEQKKEIVEPKPEEMPPEENNQNQDEPPPGTDLGLDAEGNGAGDGFGLVGRPGGRGLIGGSGDRTLMQRYGWYARMIQEKIRKNINAYMAKNGGIPQGDHKAIIYIVLDSQGRIVDFKLQERSGNNKMDQALKETLVGAHINEAPPIGMPRSLRLKVTSKG